MTQNGRALVKYRADVASLYTFSVDVSVVNSLVSFHPQLRLHHRVIVVVSFSHLSRALPL